MFGSFVFGLLLPFRAARLILSRRSLFLWSLLPVAISIALYSIVLIHLQDFAREGVLHLWADWGWNPTGWGATLTVMFVKVLVWVLGAVTFSVGASVIASPFNDFLAEAAERAAPALLAAPSPSVGDRIQQVFIDASKSIAALIAGLVALALSWIPGLNLAAMIAVWLLVAFQYISYPQTRRGENLVQALRFLLSHFFSCLGLGITLSFGFALPLVSVFVLPVAVVSGTLLYARAMAPSLPKLR